MKLADCQEAFDDSGTMACKTLFLARIAAERSDDPVTRARVRDAARRLVCPQAP